MSFGVSSQRYGRESLWVLDRLAERRRHGVFVARVLVTCEMVEALVDRGDLDEANSGDPDHVGEAIAAAARRDLDLT